MTINEGRSLLGMPQSLASTRIEAGAVGLVIPEDTKKLMNECLVLGDKFFSLSQPESCLEKN